MGEGSLRATQRRTGARNATGSATTNTLQNAVLLFDATTSQRRACACTSPGRSSRVTVPELLLGSCPPLPQVLFNHDPHRHVPFLAPPARSRDASVFLSLCGGSLGPRAQLYFFASHPGLKPPTGSAPSPPFRDLDYVPPQSSVLFPVSALLCSSTKSSNPAATPVVPSRSPFDLALPAFCIRGDPDWCSLTPHPSPTTTAVLPRPAPHLQHHHNGFSCTAWSTFSPSYTQGGLPPPLSLLCLAPSALPPRIQSPTPPTLKLFSADMTQNPCTESSLAPPPLFVAPALFFGVYCFFPPSLYPIVLPVGPLVRIHTDHFLLLTHRRVFTELWKLPDSAFTKTLLCDSFQGHRDEHVLEKLICSEK